MKNEFRVYKYCRFCFGKSLIKVINLGKMPLAGGFLKNKTEIKKEKKYLLKLNFCKKCLLVQTSIVINRDILFKNYYYSSSSIATLVSHFKKFGRLFKKRYSNKSFIVEIGSNDGIFLKILKNEGFKVLGVDPSQNLTKPLKKENINVINDYFSEKIARKIQKTHGNADIVVSSNTLAHIEDMHDIIKGIKILLRKDGILIFENHYLVNLIKETQYDMIYHEHQYYYSVMSLMNFFSMHGMEIYNVEKIPTHAGSIRVFVQNKKYGSNKISPSVGRFIKLEKKIGINKLSTYNAFEGKVKRNKKELLKILNKLKKGKKSIAGYGASGRGTILSNYCNLDSNLLEFVIDDSKIKQGLFTPGNHLKIISSAILKSKKKPDYIILLAWSFINEITRKNKNYLLNGGKFIIPLPKIKIISKYE